MTRHGFFLNFWKVRLTEEESGVIPGSLPTHKTRSQRTTEFTPVSNRPKKEKPQGKIGSYRSTDTLVERADSSNLLVVLFTVARIFTAVSDLQVMLLFTKHS